MLEICKFQVYCETDSKWEFVLGTSAPTKCPTDAGHTIRTDSIAVMDVGVDLDDGTPKELPLPEYKQLRYNAIDSRTGEIIAAGFSYDGHSFSLSLPAQNNWNILKDQESEFTWPVDISTLDNDEYSLSQANVSAFWNVGKDTLKGHLDSGRALKKSIFDAIDEAAVDAVVDTR